MSSELRLYALNKLEAEAVNPRGRYLRSFQLRIAFDGCRSREGVVALGEVVGDFAYCHGSSTTTFSLPDGTRHSAKSRSTTVLHRGDDGLWRLVLDHAS